LPAAFGNNGDKAFQGEKTTLNFLCSPGTTWVERGENGSPPALNIKKKKGTLEGRHQGKKKKYFSFRLFEKPSTSLSLPRRERGKR